VVRVSIPEEGVELFSELADGGRFGAHPPLFENDVAFGVELAEDRPEEALAFHPHPQLELVGRDSDEVGRHVLRGEGVHARGTGSGVHAVELVLHQHLALSIDEFLELSLEFAVTGALGFRAGDVGDIPSAQRGPELGLLETDFVTQALLLLHDLAVLDGIFGAQGRGALEHHVFKEMGDAGHPRLFIRGPHVGHPTARDARFSGTLHHQQLHAIGEGLLVDWNLLPLSGPGDTDRNDRRQKAPALCC